AIHPVSWRETLWPRLCGRTNTSPPFVATNAVCYQMLPQASPNAHAGGNRAGGYEYAILSLHRFARATLYRFAQTYRPFAMPNCTSTHIPRVDVAKPA